MKPAIALLAILCLALAAVPARCDPYLGFVTVPGDIDSDDLGPDPRILGEALNYSAATVVRAAPDEIEHLPLNGRPGVGLAWGDISDSMVRRYNDNGYFHFIFENEPDGTSGVNPDWASDYMGRLSGAYPGMKAVNGANVVIGGNLAGQDYNPLYDNGLKGASDMIGYHNYSNDPSNGIQIAAVKAVRDIMVARGDGAKKIFLGEGWGPMRELPGLKRLFPDAEITAGELQMLRDFVVNGYWNIVTPKSGYDPSWVWGVLFFTLNDNWGGGHWADRAVPVKDSQGNILTYLVDGYNVGLDIFPHFYNGGLIDIDGNAKDNLMDIFPGKGLALANSGFEYWDRESGGAIGASWSPKTSPPPAERYGLDASIRRGGQRSQRITLSSAAITYEYVSQTTLKGSITPGESYCASVWVKTFEVVRGTSPGAMVRFEFLDSSGAIVGNSSLAGYIGGTTDWTKLTATGVAPSGTDRIRVYTGLYASTGRAWFDDLLVWKGSPDDTSTLAGYVLDTYRNAVPGAVVRTETGSFSGVSDSAGHFQIAGVSPGVYDITASKAGYTSRTARAQLALPGGTRPLGFSLPAAKPSVPTGLAVRDGGVGGLLKLSWKNPAGPFDYVRIYRSTDPSQRGDLVHDHVTAESLWDSGLQDGTKYSYTMSAVLNGIESEADGRCYGIATGGVISTPYSYYSSAQWGHWASDYGQTFAATTTGSLASASCTPGFGGGGGAALTFRLLAGGPGGAQIGPSRTKPAGGDSECTVTWSQGEVPVEAGQTYYLHVTGSAGFAAYRGPNVYSQGRFYVNGAATTSDMWSTITISKAGSVTITDVSASPLPGGRALVRWTTSAPAGSQVEFGESEAYGSITSPDSLDKTSHSVLLDGLVQGRQYHYRVRSPRPGSPEAVSLDYVFAALSGQAMASPGQAAGSADGTEVALEGVVTAVFDGYLYIEDPARSSGIRVVWTGSPAAPGTAVSVAGTMRTDPSNERYVEASAVWPLAQGVTIAPLAVGGRDSQSPSGLDATGLLVEAWGRVTDSEPGSAWLDDGSNAVGCGGQTGLRIQLNGAPAPVVGSFVRAVGLLSRCDGGGNGRLLLLRSASDITRIDLP